MSGRRNGLSAREIEKYLVNFDSDKSDLDIEDDIDDEELIATPSRTPQLSDEEQSSDDDDEESNIPLSQLRERYPKWRHKDDFDPPLIHDIHEDLEEVLPTVRKPFEYFSEYFDNCFFEELALSSNTTYMSRNGKDLQTTTKELKTFFGASIILSLLGFPRLRMAWESRTRYPLVADNITRDRFYHLRNNLRMVNENTVTTEAKTKDRFWKVRPLCDRIRNKCLLYERPASVSIDEQIIPFEGHVAMRQYVKGKPNPVGIKNFVMTSTNGLPLDFLLYEGQGREIKSNKVPLPEKLDVGGKVVLNLADTLPNKTHIYMDRYFTSTTLFDTLLKHRSILASGTIMASRIPKNVRLNKDSELRKERGSYDQTVRNDGVVSLIKWFDNKPIHFLSTAHGVQPIENCRRWSKKDNRYIEIPRPHAIKRYNECMGGVDLLDRVISKYAMRGRTKKWTIRVLHHFFDFVKASCWIQYRQQAQLNQWPKKQILSYYFFKLDVAEHLIYSNTDDDRTESDSNDEPQTKQRRTVPLPPKVARKSKHLPEMYHDEQSSRSKCRAEGCKSLTFVRCDTCKVFLCFTRERNCFKQFHSN